MIVNEAPEKYGAIKAGFFRLAGSFQGYYVETESDAVIQVTDQGKTLADTTEKIFHNGRTP
jgi:hypothetical protein